MRCELDCQEFEQINIQRWGDIIYSKAVELSNKVNEDLLVPMGRWISDPDWSKKFQIIEGHDPNWSTYKNGQRNRIKRLKALCKVRLMNYRQEIRKRLNFRKEISGLSNRIQPWTAYGTKIKVDIISPIVSPFSPPERRQTETLHQFRQSRRAPFSDLLPWRFLLSSELNSTKLFSDLKAYGHDRQDKSAKLIHLLHMETEGEIKIIQEKAFGEIRIEPMDIVPMHNIMVKDRHSCKYFFKWDNLSDNQRDKIIADIKANKILFSEV